MVAKDGARPRGGGAAAMSHAVLGGTGAAEVGPDIRAAAGPPLASGGGGGRWRAAAVKTQTLEAVSGERWRRPVAEATAATAGGGAGRGRWCHSHAPALFVLCGDSRMVYTGAHGNGGNEMMRWDMMEWDDAMG
jgi:hypothetical protein